jgi:hypothetical protein
MTVPKAEERMHPDTHPIESPALTSEPPQGARRFLPYLLIWVFAVAANFWLGKDVTWDLVNYQLYSAHAFLNYDLASDFMGSSAQRYLNPLANLPFYWMYMANWSDYAIAIAFASFHCLALMALWRIIREHLFDADTPLYVSVGAFVLGIVSPAAMGTMGGTHTDWTVAVFVFWGMLVACVAIKKDQRRFWILSGLLLGIATGLKPTSLVYALGLYAGIAFASATKKAPLLSLLRSSAPYILGGVIGLVAVSGHWYWQVYQEFGNPTFPMANQFFKSPDFPAVALSHARFAPISIEDWLLAPFRFAIIHNFVYIEPPFPDLRFIFLPVALVIAGMALWIARIRNASTKNIGQERINRRARRMLFATFAASYVLWQLTSGNGRYAVPTFLLVGPIIVYALYRASSLYWSNRTKFAFKFVVTIMVCWQALHGFAEGTYRWTEIKWSGKWFEIGVEEKLREHPYGFLTVGMGVMSAYTIATHPDSRFINIVGAYTIDPSGPGSKRVHEFMERFEGRLRVVVEAPRRERFQMSVISQYADGALSAWGLEVDIADCQWILTNALSQYRNIACAVKQIGQDPIVERERVIVGRALDKVERDCPSLFIPKTGVYTELHAGTFRREYVGMDARMFVRGDRILYSRYPQGPHELDLGTVKGWEADQYEIDCIPLSRPWQPSSGPTARLKSQKAENTR